MHLNVHHSHVYRKLRPGTKKRVLIYGVGGLGHQALQIVKSYGATVFAVDYKKAARELAVELGAERALSLSEITSETTAGTFTVDVVIDFVVNEQCSCLYPRLSIGADDIDSVLIGEGGDEG